MEDDLGQPEDAERHYRLAVESGMPNAMYNLACLLMEGQRVTEGLEWFGRAAEGGHAGAMFTLGELAWRGGNLDLARHWLRRAADAGNERADTALRSLESTG